MALNYQTIKSEYKALLQDVLITNNIETLEQKNKSLTKVPVDIRAALDQAFRDFGLELLERECDIHILKDFVKLSIEVCRKEMATATIPVMLLADIFDSLTLEVCEDMFTFVEEEVHVWKEDLFFTSCKNNLLRMCNDLLRRLSRSSATVFCGRILLFLAKFFPFSERSGLNIVSEFNLENVTEYGADASQESVTEIEVEGSKKSIVIDYSLYCKFWSLQDFFRNPNQCYTKVQWKLFCSHATSILSTFQGLKLDYVSKELDDGDNDDTPYFSKYLTNQKLLDLQIYDVNFRRYVLLQFLILFQYLTSNVKFKSESYELKSDQKEWVQNVTEKVYTLLKETPPDGDKFAVIIKNILLREENWNIWKNDGCPEFKTSISHVDQTVEKCKKTIYERPLVGDLLKEAHSTGKYYLGSSELTKLWNFCSDNLEASKAKDRDFLPTLDNYFSDAITQLESPTAIKQDEMLLKDGNFGWRALRLLARRSPHFFTYSNNPINQLPDYLEMMVRKIAADRPGRVQEPNDQNDVELEENLFKEEEQTNEEMKQDDEFTDDHNAHIEPLRITPEQLHIFSNAVAYNWKALAAKLGYQPDEIKFFEDENPTEFEQARNVLQLWFEDDDDASVENLAYFLEGLGMMDAAETVKAAVKSVE
ncbi:hypothetical protein FQR65_LT15445 [Abscondita terminalis]|nr:hypothetical protein FQR65_LT15445 [Abscondita terminalis]